MATAGYRQARQTGAAGVMVAVCWLGASSVLAQGAGTKAPVKPSASAAGSAQPASSAGSATSAAPASSAGPDGAAQPAGSAKPESAKPEPGKPEPAKTEGGGDGEVDGATYLVRMRDLEQKIDELKEQIRRSHTRLSLLSETILSGGVGGARAEIRFRNDMSTAFRLTRAIFVLDGAVQYNKQDDTGALAAQTMIPIFNGSVPPGDHTLQVLVQLRGHGYGVFSYLRGYKFEVKSSHSFTVTEGKTIDLTAVAFEKGGVTTALEQRPAVRYQQNVKNTAQPARSEPTGGN